MTELHWSDDASAQLRGATAMAHDAAVLVLDERGRMVGADEAASTVLGIDPLTLLGRTPDELAWRLTRPDGSPLPASANPAVRALDSGDPVLDEVLGLEISREGLSTFAWYAVSALPVRAADGATIGVVTTLRDVSASDAGRSATATMARALRDLARASAVDGARFRLLAEASEDVLLQTDIAGRVVWVSGSVRDVLGWDAQSLLGSSSLPLLHPEDRERLQAVRRAALASGIEPEERIDLRYATAEGGWRWMSVLVRQMRDQRGQVVGGLAALRDIEDQMEGRARQRYVAGHDPLTGLLDRDAGVRALSDALTAARGSGRVVGALVLDLDGFARTNAEHGAAAGDRVLARCAARLRGSLRDTDSVARLGGDEFLVVLTGLREDAHAASRAESLRTLLSAPGEDAPSVGVSIGVAADDGTGDPGTVLSSARDALARAKSAGGARISR